MSKLAEDFNELLGFRNELVEEYLSLKKKRDVIRIKAIFSLSVSYILFLILVYFVLFQKLEVFFLNLIIVLGIMSLMVVSVFVTFILTKRLSALKRELKVKKFNIEILIEKIFEYYKYLAEEMSLSPIEQLKFEMQLKTFRLEEDSY